MSDEVGVEAGPWSEDPVTLIDHEESQLPASIEADVSWVPAAVSPVPIPYPNDMDPMPLYPVALEPIEDVDADGIPDALDPYLGAESPTAVDDLVPLYERPDETMSNISETNDDVMDALAENFEG